MWGRYIKLHNHILNARTTFVVVGHTLLDTDRTP